MSATNDPKNEFTPNSLYFDDLLASSDKATLGFRSCDDDLKEISSLIRQFVPGRKLPNLPEDILYQWLLCMDLDDKTNKVAHKLIQRGGEEERSQPFEHLKCRKVAVHRQSFLESALQVFKAFETTGMATIAVVDFPGGKPMDPTLKQKTDAPLQRIREIVRHLEVALEHNQGLPGVFSSEE